MDKKAKTIFTENIEVPEIVQKKANIALEMIKREEQIKMDKKVKTGFFFRKQIAAVAIIAIALAGVSGTAYAAWKYLSAKDIAQKLGDETLSMAFEAEETWGSGERQSYGGYDVSMIGLVSGEEISNQLVTANGEVIADNTYAVVAISRTDGTPMPETLSDEYGKQDFLVSPYIEGYDPAIYNIFSLKAGGYSAIVSNGIEYRIMQVENIEPFANHTIYLGVSDGTFFNNDAYRFDELTGTITRNEDYTGVNALFVLPIDKSKADEKRAAEIIECIHNYSDEEEPEYESWMGEDIDKLMEKITPENIDEYAKPVEATRQTYMPDANGEYTYRYELPDGQRGHGTSTVDFMFPDGKTGMSEFMGYSASEDGLDSLIIETYTLNEDGTVTFVIYVPKK